MQTTLKQQLVQAASKPYRAAGWFHYHWARGKLGNDPIFTALLEQATLQKSARVLDLGCGRGLLAAWFLAAEQLALAGQWKPTFAIPTGLVFHGIDIDAEDCAAGEQALQAHYAGRVSLASGDMSHADLRGFDAITILDVLHYIPLAQQDVLLDNIRAALGPNGLLVTRVGNAGSGWRFRFSQWVDHAITYARGHGLHPQFCRPLPDWVRALEARGFSVTTQAMSEGTLFANVLLVARVAPPVSQPPGVK
jgi:cyclopropane fatty-acyl-phospholipid synthase-like methyltransferase